MCVSMEVVGLVSRKKKGAGRVVPNLLGEVFFKDNIFLSKITFNLPNNKKKNKKKEQKKHNSQYNRCSSAVLVRVGAPFTWAITTCPFDPGRDPNMDSSVVASHFLNVD